MPAGTIPPEVFATLNRGATVLTANQRAARTLRQAYDRHMRPATTWSPPEIYALDTWLATLWHQLIVDGCETALLLNPAQEHNVWRNILAADQAIPAFRNLDALAELAAGASDLLHFYKGSSRLRGAAIGTDAKTFGRWFHAFTQTCTRNSHLTPAQLPATLEAALAQGNLPLTTSGILLLDFDILRPATQQMFESIQRAGYPVERLTTSTPTAAANLYAASDDASELRAAAAWARDYLARHPAATIGVVVPNLAERRPALDRAFAATLPANGLYEFSLGTPLAQTSLAASALNLLHWTVAALPLDRITTLLLSPSLVAPSETLAAAEFDAYDIRAAPLLRPELTLEAFLTLLLASPRRVRLPALQNSARSLRSAAAKYHADGDAAQSHAYWTNVFRDTLEASGWCQASPLDSTTYQMWRRWDGAFDELATLDFDGTRVPASAALSSLTRIVRQTIFAPESYGAPIQILGPLELGGVPFDALWFLSADDSWPPPPSTNPLIPWALQRDLLLPGADTAQDVAAAQALTQRIARSASEVIFSYAVHAEDAERRPSPLLDALNLTPLAVLQHPLAVLQQVPHSHPLALETYPDDEPLPPLPAGPLSGGAQVLELQAACPFRAFAERRLFSAAPEARLLGLDARQRGSLVHQVMQAFWTRVQSQSSLRALTPPTRHAILGDCIDHALGRHRRRKSTSWDEAYLEVQRSRLHSVLTPWLDFELTRPPFTVDQQETALHEARIGPLTLNLRVDRIDLTAAGPLILDYKTGNAAPSEWLGERPDAPQLPLYAVLAGAATLAGVAFANLRAGDGLSLHGFSDSPDVLDKPTRNSLSLPEQRKDWDRILTDLATAFAEGDTNVDPKCYPETCRYCTQRALCRLDPGTLQDISEEEDELGYAEADS